MCVSSSSSPPTGQVLWAVRSFFKKVIEITILVTFEKQKAETWEKPNYMLMTGEGLWIIIALIAHKYFFFKKNHNLPCCGPEVKLIDNTKEKEVRIYKATSPLRASCPRHPPPKPGASVANRNHLIKSLFYKTCFYGALGLLFLYYINYWQRCWLDVTIGQSLERKALTASWNGFPERERGGKYIHTHSMKLLHT